MIEKKNIFNEKHAPQARFLLKKNAPQARLVKKNAPLARSPNGYFVL